MMDRKFTYKILATTATIACLLVSSSALAQYNFNRSGHTGSIAEDTGDMKLDLEGSEEMRIHDTGRVQTQGGVQISDVTTCAASDVGTIRYFEPSTGCDASASPQTFTTPGAATSYTVTAATSGCTFTIEVKGAGGGNGGFQNVSGYCSSFYDNARGGDGGGTQFDFAPSGTGTFEILVGGGGEGCSDTTNAGQGGINGGGDPGQRSPWQGGGGGGASAILFDDGTDEILAIAGGGGGGGHDFCDSNYDSGGDGGSLNNSGSDGTDCDSDPGGGGGGSDTGGAGDGNGGAGGSSGGNGSNATGTDPGSGGTGNATFNISGGGGGQGNNDGGGGGAGYGGGGGGDWEGGGGGGGGFLETSPTSGTISNSSAIAGGVGGPADGGDGSVTITWAGDVPSLQFCDGTTWKTLKKQ